MSPTICSVCGKEMRNPADFGGRIVCNTICNECFSGSLIPSTTLKSNFTFTKGSFDNRRQGFHSSNTISNNISNRRDF